MPWSSPLLCAALAFQAPESSPPPPTAPLMTEAEARLRALEGETRRIRDEVRQQLADAAVIPEQAANRAKKAWDDAIRARKAAEEEVRAYIGEVLPQDIETSRGEIALAKYDVEQAQARFDWRQKAVDARREVAGHLYIADRMSLERAKFELETAETQLNVQEKYSGPKETRRLEALVAAAVTEEQIKQREYEAQADRLRKRQAESARLQARTPEDLVVAILDDVVQREGRIVELTTELGALQADPARAGADRDRIQANRDAIANTARQIKEDLALATAVAEEARQARDRLFQAEKRLIVARRRAGPAGK